MSDKPILTEVRKVAILPVITSLDLPTERILQAALAWKYPLQSAVVIGYDSNGQLQFWSSIASGPETLWLLEKTKERLLDVAED